MGALGAVPRKCCTSLSRRSARRRHAGGDPGREIADCLVVRRSARGGMLPPNHRRHEFIGLTSGDCAPVPSLREPRICGGRVDHRFGMARTGPAAIPPRWPGRSSASRSTPNWGLSVAPQEPAARSSKLRPRWAVVAPRRSVGFGDAGTDIVSGTLAQPSAVAATSANNPRRPPIAHPASR